MITPNGRKQMAEVKVEKANGRIVSTFKATENDQTEPTLECWAYPDSLHFEMGEESLILNRKQAKRLIKFLEKEMKL